jgi:hypothetical protein
MSDAVLNEWDVPEPVVLRLLDFAVIAPLDRTPFRQPCRVWGCVKDSYRERTDEAEHPWLFTCEYGHAVPTPASY